MKKNGRFTFFLVLITLLCLFGEAGANTWEDIFRNLSAGKTITPGVKMSSPVYEAHLTYTVTDGDGIANNFSNKDSVKLFISGNGESLSFSGTRPQLISWATAHSTPLLRIIFGSSPETAFSGSTSSSFNVQQFFINMWPSLGSSTQNGFIPVTTKDVVVTGQYDFMTIGPAETSATGSSGLLNYEWRFGENAANSIGIGIPYRNIKLDDSLDSKYQFASFLPYYKHRWYLSDRSVVEWLVNLALDVTYLKSSLFSDGSGYIEYGGGTGARYGYNIVPNLDVNVGLTYELLKKNIPSDLVPKDVVWLSDAINSLPVEQDLVPSLGVIWNVVPKKFSFRGEVFRIMQLQSGVDSDMRNQTVALGFVNFKPSRLVQVTAGYKRSFEIKDLTDQSVIASVRFSW